MEFTGSINKLMKNKGKKTAKSFLFKNRKLKRVINIIKIRCELFKIVVNLTSSNPKINIKDTQDVNVKTPKIEWVKLLCCEK